MMNKKGNASRIILWCLFFVIIGFLIYTLVLTYKEIKKKNPSTENVTTSMVDFAPRFAYNNDFEYSAADYITSCYFNYYAVSDVVFQKINGSIQSLDLSTIQPIYVRNSINTLLDEEYSMQNRYLNYNIRAHVNDNVLNFSDILKYLYPYASDYIMNKGYGSAYNMNWFNYPTTNPYSMSGAIVLECDIPINLFNGSLSGNYNTGNVETWLLGDDNNLYRYYFNGGNFSYSSLPSAFIANCAYIKKWVIPTWQSTNSNGLSYYLVGNSYNYNYFNVSSDSFNLTFNFQVYTQNSSYQDGYNSGYADGINSADAALVDYNSQLVNENISLHSQIDSLSSRIEQQQIVINNLQATIDSSSNNFRGLFFTMADIPFRTVSNALGFEFWGVNLFQFFIGIITALGIIWLIKKIL